MDSGRDLTESESSRLNYLLSFDFPGVAELREQARVARVERTAQDERVPSAFRFLLPGDVNNAPLAAARPILGRCKVDANLLEWELYAPAGRLFMMGFVYLNAPVIEPPIPDVSAFSIYVGENNKVYRKILDGSLPTFDVVID